MKTYGTSQHFAINPADNKMTQCRAVVAAKTKKAAAAAFWMSMHTFNKYVAETGNKTEIDMAMYTPGKVVIVEFY